MALIVLHVYTFINVFTGNILGLCFDKTSQILQTGSLNKTHVDMTINWSTYLAGL